MLIYFIEKTKIYTFKLPMEISGNYILTDYDMEGNKRSLVNVEAIDGKWVIRKNDEVNISYNNKHYESIDLKLYNFYKLSIYNSEEILMYVAPVYDNTFIYKSVVGNNTISVGNGTADIICKIPSLASRQIEIYYNNGKISFKNLNPTIPVYINNVRKDSGDIDNLDTLFMLGLKIVFLGENIFINNPNKIITIMSSNLASNHFKLICDNYNAEAEFYKDFYDEKDYFFRTPVFQNNLKQIDLDIASPPNKSKNERDPLFLIVIPSAIMGISSILMGYYAFLEIGKKDADNQSIIMTLVMCVGMLISSIVWPFVERLYEKYSDGRNERRRVKLYTKYINKKDKILSEMRKNQKMILLEQNLSLAECANAIYRKTANLFSRQLNNPKFLDVRLGLGNVELKVNINYSKEEYNEITDKMLDRVDEVIKNNMYVENAPYVLSLYEKNTVSFIGPDYFKYNFMNSILLQLLTYHSYEDLKIVVLSDTSVNSSLKFLKESNYCWDSEKTFRFFANSFEDGQIISEYLEKEFTARSKNINDVNQKVTTGPYYLIISDNIAMYKNLKIVNDIVDGMNNVGFGLVIFDSKVSNIPSGCKYFVNYTDKEAYCFSSKMSSDNVNKFIPEFVGKDINVEECVSLVSNIPIKEDTKDGMGTLPEHFGFLEMYGVGRIEQLNMVERWNSSNIVNSLATPVGIDSNGNILNLDLHEKKHGPHGLIAGMTGSGKSEYIITYILSLAVNYSPKEVQFVLIDYKGGGLAGAFENRKTGVKLPHLVGTITNLDQAEMKRTLVSIKSELQRRQKLFNEAKEKLDTGTIDIYKYQRLVRDGKIEKPLSHLFIICDEFAELKAQQPDFMDELISTARIGRSLGVHLILATQKPSGVVDDQIWSNSKFKVCCKVQTVEDSNEMIRRPDAAYIKEAGRFFLQVGYDEYFVKGQSAYTGGTYVPSDKTRSKVSDTVEFVNDVGEVIRSEKKEKVTKVKVNENLGEELINVLNLIIAKAKSIGYENTQLWLDKIPKELYLEDVRKKYQLKAQPFNIKPLIGEYDDPKHQTQGPVLLPITENGNIFITGVSHSGKSTMLSTILYSIITTHDVSEVNFFVIDLVSENLLKFSRAPQVGDVLTINDKEKIERLFYYLKKVIVQRKQYYVENGGSFAQDVQKGKSKYPNIIVIINGIDIFREQFENLHDDLFAPITRDCNRMGITFIVTGTTTNSLGYGTENNFPNVIATKFLDTSDYSLFFENTQIVPNDNPGRGLIKLDNVYEFQTALSFALDNFENNISYIIKQLNKYMPKKATKIPVMPSIVKESAFDTMDMSLSRIPIGIEIKSALPLYYNFDNLVNIVLYNKDQSIKNFMVALVNMFSKLENTTNIVLSAYDFIEIKDTEKIKFYNANFKSITRALYKNINKVISENKDSNYIFTIMGYSKLVEHFNKLKEEEIDNKELYTIDDLILLSKDSTNIRFVLVDQDNVLTSIDNVSWNNYVTLDQGILVAVDCDDIELFNVSNEYGIDSLDRDQAMVISDGEQDVIKFINK